MPLLPRLASLFCNLFRKDRAEQELTQEINAYLELMTEMKIKEGLEPQEARRAALIEMGGVEQVKESVREVRIGHYLETIWQDVRYGLRVLLKKPGFTVIAVATLALGIGATTAIFSVVNGVLLRPLPYKDDARIVTLWQSRTKSGVQKEEVSPANFTDWHERLQSYEAIAMAEPFGHSMIGNGEPESFRSWVVSSGFFDILGVPALYGRTFLPEEYEPGRSQVVVLGYGLWQRRFGGDTGLIGQQLTLNGQPFTVVGVMPPQFQYPPGRELWAPRPPRENDRQIRGATYIIVIGRLKTGLAVEQAQAEIDTIATQMAQEYPQTNSDVGALVLPIREYMVGQVRPALLIMFGAVCFVLLIACANVASLLLARAAERRREFAIRAALGAGRRRLLRQLIVESLLLAFLGGASGILLSMLLIELIVTVNPGNLPHLDRVSFNGLVFVFATVVSILTAVMFSLTPALRLARPDLQETLRQEGHTTTFGRGRQRLRKFLVVAEVALAMVLLIGAGLLVRSFVTLLRVDPGFATERALTLEIQLGRIRAPEQRLAFIEQTLERVSQLPGVRTAGAASAVPFHDNQVMIPTAIAIEGRPQALGQEPAAYVINATSDYLSALGVPLLSGRALTQFDRPDSTPVAVINQTMAQLHWPTEDPLGKKITFQTFGRTGTCEIVGVVGATLPNGLDSQPRPEVFLPYAQSPAGGMTYFVRTDGDPANMLAAVKEKIREVNPNQTFSSISTVEQLVDRTISQRRFNLLLLGIFAGLALVLASVGLYGLISFTTAQRTHEIGIRMALGAQGRDVLKLIIGQGIRLIVIGLAAGLIAASGLTRLMGSLLFGVSATDPLTFALISLLLATIALLACYIPARRALMIDPMVALRYK